MERFTKEALEAGVDTIVAAGGLCNHELFRMFRHHTAPRAHIADAATCVRLMFWHTGGDGSVNQLASALVSLDAPSSTAMAVIPLGTANDFATGLGIPEVWQLASLNNVRRN